MSLSLTLVITVAGPTGTVTSLSDAMSSSATTSQRNGGFTTDPNPTFDISSTSSTFTPTTITPLSQTTSESTSVQSESTSVQSGSTSVPSGSTSIQSGSTSIQSESQSGSTMSRDSTTRNTPPPTTSTQPDPEQTDSDNEPTPTQSQGSTTRTIPSRTIPDRPSTSDTLSVSSTQPDDTSTTTTSDPPPSTPSLSTATTSDPGITPSFPSSSTTTSDPTIPTPPPTTTSTRSIPERTDNVNEPTLSQSQDPEHPTSQGSSRPTASDTPRPTRTGRPSRSTRSGPTLTHSTSESPDPSSPIETTTSTPREDDPEPTRSMSTLSSVYSRTVTDPNGNPSVEIPPYFTTIYQTTDSDGSTITVTNVAVNPTGSLSSDSEHQVPTFFRNRAAVAAVFCVAGIVLTSLVILFFLTYRRRKRERLGQLRLEQGQQRRMTTERQGAMVSQQHFAATGSMDLTGSEGRGTANSRNSSDPHLEVMQRPLSPNNYPSRMYAAPPSSTVHDTYGQYHNLQQGEHQLYSTADNDPFSDQYNANQYQYDQEPYEQQHFSDLLQPGGFISHRRRAHMLHDDGNQSSISLPTLDHVLDPSHRRHGDEDRSFLSEHGTLHDEVDYTRKVRQPQPSGLR